LLKFETLLESPAQCISELESVLQLKALRRRPLLPERPNLHLAARLVRRLQIHPKNTVIDGRYQGKAPVDWREVFTEEDCRYFHDIGGKLLIDLGYELSDSWISERLPSGAQ
jgi:hypothetical protein